MLEPSRQVAQRKLQHLLSGVVAARDHMEDVRDHMAFVMDGLRRGELQWTPQLIPILLEADGKVPKGFENFFPKGASKGPAMSDKPKPEAKPSEGSDPKASTASRSSDDTKKPEGGSGGGGKGSGSMPEFPGSQMQLLALAVTAGLLLLMMSVRNDGREINFQEFLNSLLVDGRVDHLQVINQRIVRVFLKVCMMMWGRMM